MKKSKILKYLLLIVPFLLTIGFSTWVIIYEFNFGPNKQETTLSSLFGTEQEGTYCAKELLPVQINGDPINESRLSYQYKAYGADDSTYDAGGPIDAGVYNIKITVANEDGSSEDCIIKYTVNPRKLNVNTVEMDYSQSLRKYSDFVNNRQNYIKFYDEKGIVDTLFYRGAYTIDAMHNGVYYYGTLSKIDNVADKNTLSAPLYSDYLIGSTYVMQLSIINDNFVVRDAITKEYTSNPHILLKYKTAKVGDKFYTIEDAIKNQSGTITLAGYTVSNVNEYVSTCFSKLTDVQGNPYSSGYYSDLTFEEKSYRKFTINSSNTLLVPYKDSLDDYEKLDSTSVNGYIYSNLIVPNEINLTFESKAKLNVGGILAVQGRTSRPSVLLNHGLITMKSGSELKSYGFLKGTGLVVVESGAKAWDVMIMHEWSGGSAAISLKSSCFPVVAWTFHNISCPMRIMKGAELRGFATISVTLLGYIPFDFLVIGSNSSSGECLFRPSSTATNQDYIFKSGYSTTNDLNEKVSISNKLNTQKDIVKVYGDYEDSSLSISYGTYSFKTSTSISVPISNMDIVVTSGSNLVVKNSSYVFLLGTSLTIETDGIADIQNSSAYVAFDRKATPDSDGSTAMICPYFGGNSGFRSSDKDAQLIVNGSLIGSGKVGGIASTKASGGQLNVSTYQIDSITFKSSQTEKQTLTFNNEGYKLSGLIGNSTSQTQDVFNSGSSYITTTVDNSNFYFTTPENVKIFTLKFYDEGKTTLLKEIKKQVLFPETDDENYIGQYIYKVTGNEYTRYKKYYKFENWLTIDTNQLAKTVVLTESSNTISFYPSYSIISYSFNYNVEYEDSTNNITNPIIGHEEFSMSNENANFDYTVFNSSSLNITTTVTFKGKVFYGWYLGYDESGVYLGTTLSKVVFDNYLNNASAEITTIPLYACFKDYFEYTINYIDNQNDLSFTAKVDVINNDELTWPGMQYYSNPEEKYYCLGWYLDSEFKGTKVDGYTKFDASVFKNFANSDNVINVYGNFTEKRSIVYKNDDEILATKYYLSQDDITSLGVPNFEQYISYTPQKEIEGYTYSNWIDSNDNTYAYDGVTISTFTSKVTELQLNKTPIPYTITITNENTSITVTVNESPVTSGGQIPYNSTVSVSIKANDGYKNASYTVTNDTTGSTITVSSNKFTMPASDVTIKGTAEEDKSCVVSGTLLTLADGTQKKVEDILDTDMLLVFNHETGKFEASPIIFVDRDEWKNYNIVNLEFSNGTKTRLIYEHGYFNLTLNKYVYITEANYQDYIGHEFAFYDGDKVNSVTLTNSYITSEYVGCYSPVTAYHLNYFVDGMLSMPGGIEGLFNIFEYNDDMTYDIEKMNEDIEKYGLYTYEDFKDYLPYEVYLAFPGPYLKVSVEKGYITFEEIIGYIEQYLGRHGLDK